jgi:RimJ/RimL family protein N-acetyltransferase
MDTAVELPDGLRLRIRPVRAEDKALILEAFARLSSRSRYLRFFAPLHDLSEPMLTALTLADPDHFAWVALACEGDHEAVAGVARYVRLKDPHSAELALTVVDAYQGRGIGHLLLDALVLEAVQAGLSRFEGEILGDNLAIRAVLAAAGARLHLNDHGSVGFTLDLAPRAEAVRAHPAHFA